MFVNILIHIATTLFNTVAEVAKLIAVMGLLILVLTLHANSISRSGNTIRANVVRDKEQKKKKTTQDSEPKTTQKPEEQVCTVKEKMVFVEECAFLKEITTIENNDKTENPEKITQKDVETKKLLTPNKEKKKSIIAKKTFYVSVHYTKPTYKQYVLIYDILLKRKIVRTSTVSKSGKFYGPINLVDSDKVESEINKYFEFYK